MRSVVWRGFPRWRSGDEDAALGDVSSGTADHRVDELVTALTADPRPHELTGLTESMAIYRALIGAPQLTPATTRRTPVHSGLLSAKAAAAFGGVALGLGRPPWLSP